MVNHDIYALEVLGGLLESSITPPCKRAADLCRKIYEETNKPSDLSNHILSHRTDEDTFGKWFMENKYVIDDISRRIVLDSKGGGGQVNLDHITDDVVWNYFDMMFTSSIHRPAPYHTKDVGSLSDVFKIVLHNSKTTLSALNVDIKVCSYIDISSLCLMIDNDMIDGVTEFTDDVKNKLKDVIKTSGGSTIHLNALELVINISERIHKMITDYHKTPMTSSMNESINTTPINLGVFSDVYYSSMSGGCRSIVDSISEHSSLTGIDSESLMMSDIDDMPFVEAVKGEPVYEELKSYIDMFCGVKVVDSFQDSVKYRIWKDLNESFHKNIHNYKYNEDYMMERPVGLIHRIFDTVSDNFNHIGEIDLTSIDMKQAVAASAADLNIDSSFIYSSLKHTFGSHIDKEEMAHLFAYDALDQNEYKTESENDFKTDLKLVFIHTVLSYIEIRDGLSFDNIQNDICRVVCNTDGSYMYEASVIWNTSEIYNHSLNESHRDITIDLASKMRPDQFDILDTAYSYITGSWKMNEDFSFIPDNINYAVYGRDSINEDTDLVVFIDDMYESLPVVKRWHPGQNVSAMDSQYADINPSLMSKVVAGVSIPLSYIIEKIEHMKRNRQLKWLLNPKYALIFQFFEDLWERKVGSISKESDDYISLDDIISKNGKLSRYYVRNGEVFQQTDVIQWITSIDFSKFIPKKVKDFFRNIGKKIRNFTDRISNRLGVLGNSIKSKFARAKVKFSKSGINSDNFLSTLISRDLKFTVMDALEGGVLVHFLNDLNEFKRRFDWKYMTEEFGENDVYHLLADIISMRITNPNRYASKYFDYIDDLSDFLSNTEVNYRLDGMNTSAINFNDMKTRLKRLFGSTEFHLKNNESFVVHSGFIGDISEISIDMSDYTNGYGYTSESVVAALARGCINRSIPQCKVDYTDEFMMYEDSVMEVIDVYNKYGGEYSLYEVAHIIHDISERHRIDQLWKDRHKLTTVYTSSQHPREHANDKHRFFDENHMALDTLVYLFDTIANMFKVRLFTKGQDIFKVAFTRTAMALKLQNSPEQLAGAIKQFSDLYMNQHSPNVHYLLDRFMDENDEVVGSVLIQKEGGNVGIQVEKDYAIVAATFFVMLLEELDAKTNGKVSEVMEARGMIFDSWDKTIGKIKDFVSKRLPFLNKIKDFVSNAAGRFSKGYRKVMGTIQNKLGIFESDLSVEDAMMMLNESARTDADFELYNYLKND